MDPSAICAQEPTGKFPVPQVRGRSDESPGSLQHRLQVWKTLHPGHCNACPGSGKARRIEPNKSAKKQAKLLILPRLRSDFLSTGVRQDACPDCPGQ